MSDYRTLRKEERKAAMYHMALCMLAMIDDEVLDLMSMGPSIRGSINTIRAEEDDYAGCGAAFIALMISNYDLTDQDRLVVSQTLGVAAGCIATRKVVTKNVLDNEDVLTNTSILSSLGTWVSEAPSLSSLTGDALFEQGKDILYYIEQYNRAILDQSKSWTKGGTTNESEAPTTQDAINALLDLIPGVGK